MGLNLAQAYVNVRVNNAALRGGLRRSEAMVGGAMARINAMAGQIFAGLGVLGFGFALFKGAQAAAMFEDAMIRVRINADLLGKDGEAAFKRLSNEARRLGATTRFTAGEAAEAMNMLALAGLDVAQMMEATEPTLNLATAANIQLAESAKIATTQMKAFGLESSDISRISDTLVAAQANMRTTVMDLNDGMARAGTIAKKVGFSFEELAATIGILQERSGQASLAGTALSIAIQRLSAPSKDALKQLDKMGIVLDDFRKSDGELDILSVMDQISAMGITVEDSTKLFGARGKEIIKVFEAVSDAGVKGSVAVREMAKKLEEATGFAERAAKARMESFLGRLLELKSALEDVAITFLGPMLDGLLTVMRPLTTMIRRISKLNEALYGVPVDILKVTGAFLTLVLVVPRVIGAFRLLAVFLASNPYGVWILGAGMLAVALMQVIKLLRDTPTSENTQRLAQAWVNVKLAVTETAENIRIGLNNAILAVNTLFGTQISSMGSSWAEFGSKFLSKGTNWFLQMSEIVLASVRNWRLYVESFYTYWAWFPTKAAAHVEDGMNIVTAVVAGTVASLKAYFTNFLGHVKNIFSMVKGMVWALHKGLEAMFSSADISSGAERFKAAFVKAISKISQKEVPDMSKEAGLAFTKEFSKHAGKKSLLHGVADGLAARHDKANKQLMAASINSGLNKDLPPDKLEFFRITPEKSAEIGAAIARGFEMETGRFGFQAFGDKIQDMLLDDNKDTDAERNSLLEASNKINEGLLEQAKETNRHLEKGAGGMALT